MSTHLNPIIRTILAVILGLLVLILSGAIFQTIVAHSNLMNDFPGLIKTLNHSLMLVFSILLILVINKGKLKGYGFNWNINFPILKVIIISILLGFLPSLIIMGSNFQEKDFPGSDFNWLQKIIYIWLWASICEEVFTRGLIQGFLFPVKNIGINFLNRFISLPVMVGAVFFGLMHFMLLTLGISFFIVITIVIFGIVLGIIAGYYREKTNSLVPAIIVHMCFNIGGSILEIVGLF